MSDEQTTDVEPQAPALEYPDRCARCGTTDPPNEIGRCPNPKCKGIRKGGRLNIRNVAIDEAKRDQLRASFLQDYRPSTTLDRVRCIELADLTERLSTIKKGSSEYARVVATMASLDVALRQSRAIQQPPDLSSLSTDDLIAKLESLLAVARGHAAPSTTPQGDPLPFRRSALDGGGHSGLTPQNIHKSEEIQPPDSASPGTTTDKASEPRSDQSEPPRTNPTSPTAPTPAETKSAARTRSAAFCPECHADPCIGKSHPSYYTLHPEAAKAYDAAARNQAFRLSFGLPIEDATPPPPEPTIEERKAAAVREKLGWSDGVLNEQTGIYRRRE